MNTNQIARIAALVGEPARTAMLLELLDGRSLTANELARAANVGAATASRHLSLLVDAGLVEATPSGRHRYHRLASAQVARMLEGIMQIAGREAASARRMATGPRDAAMRRARTCYDHIAGRLGVAIAQKLQDDGAVAFDGESGHVTERCADALAPLGIAAASLDAAPGGRAHCRPCMDWSERRPHVAGRLGALICSHALERGWLVRRARTLDITPPGAVALREWLGPQRWRDVMLDVPAGASPCVADEKVSS